MAETDVPRDQQHKLQESNDPSEQLLLHLLRHPCDLVDARRLMRIFHVSAVEVERVLGQLEKLMPEPLKEA
jgi:hypothetical protein